MDWGETTPPMGWPVCWIEDDMALRQRLLYVAGESAAVCHRISIASGLALDTLAEEVGLRRRRSP